MFGPLLRGFGLGASLIIAIGAQNAFVLRQGLKRQYVFVTALICVLVDVGLITAGALGFGALVNAFPPLTSLAAWGGALFLLGYGALAFRSALTPKTTASVGAALDTDAPQPLPDRRAVIATALAVSLLNPHVYLDTVVLIGGLAGQYAGPERAIFALGAVLASTTWFFGLAYGAAVLAPLFRRPAAWRALDALVGVIMWGIAVGLVRGELGG